MKLHYEITGCGPDVVLLHGWAMHSGVWDGTVAALCDGYRLTCIDLPGHGRSDTGLDLTDLDAVCAALLAVAPVSAIWVGWSLGGLIALACALRDPRAVSRVTLVAGTPRFTRSPDWPHAVPADTLADFGRDLEADYEATLARFLALQIQGAEAGRQSLRHLRAILGAHPPRSLALQAGLTLLRNTDLRPELAGLGMPLRMILGGRDALAPPGCGTDTVRLARDARATVLPGAAHAPFLSHPRAFEKALRDALDD